jgi:hypothetical protein
MSIHSNSHDSVSPMADVPVVPADIISGSHQPNRTNQAFTMSTESKSQPALVTRNSSGSSSTSSLKASRTTRFAESTTVYSPVEPTEKSGLSFADPAGSQPHVSDVGFGYVNENDPSRHASHPPLTPASPLRSALKTPGTAGRLNPLSPTFKEELMLEKREKITEKDNARDVVSFSSK